MSRYGARVLPNTQQILAACKARGEFIQDAIQVPVYAALTDAQVARIAGSVRRAAIDVARKVGSAPADTAART